MNNNTSIPETSVDMGFKIWDNQDGSYHWEVSPDDDGLGLVQIRYVEKDRKPEGIVVSTSVALKIAQCVKECAERMINEEKTE